MLQQAVLYILTFVSGLFFGSFLNLVSDRVVKGEQILKGRSHCDHCKKPLKPRNLIPVISFILQRGKCDMCSKKLSWYYPFSEIITGLAFVGAAYISNVFLLANFSTVQTFVYLTIVASFYVILALTDLKYNLIPNKIVYPAIAVVFLFIVFSTGLFLYTYYQGLIADDFGQYLLEAGIMKVQTFNILKNLLWLLVSSFGIAGFFALLVWITKGRGMGGGDITLGFLIGVFNGFPFNILAIFIGFVLGAAVSLILVVFKLKSLKDTVPFGPFLIIGSVIALLWGPAIWTYYINLF